MERENLLKALCKNYTELNKEEIETLIEISRTMQYTSDLTGSDIFIDCFSRPENKCMVMAEAKPRWSKSVYDRSVVGELVSPEKEPAVFTVLETGLPVRDIIATTQENKSVRQDVIPIFSPVNESIIGVFIQERDISQDIYKDKKLAELAKTTEKQGELLDKYNAMVSPYYPSLNRDDMAMKEIHHRVKNNLQMLASILSIQGRRSNNSEVKEVLAENVNRVMSFAAIHDVLTVKGYKKEVSLHEMLRKICDNITKGYAFKSRNVSLELGQGELLVTPEKATAIVTIVNELIMNATKHAFENQESGIITVNLYPGKNYSAITVKDNGGGIPQNWQDNSSFGLNFVKLSVESELKGKLQIVSNGGTAVTFDFKN